MLLCLRSGYVNKLMEFWMEDEDMASMSGNTTYFQFLALLRVKKENLLVIEWSKYVW